MKKIIRSFALAWMAVAMASYAYAMCGQCSDAGHEAAHEHAAGEKAEACSSCAAGKDKAAGDTATETTQEAAPVAEATAAK